MFSPRTPGLEVDRVERDGVPWLRLSGELDIASSTSLTPELVGECGPMPSVVDLEGLSFMDGSGLRLLLETHRDAVGRGTSFGIVNPRAIVRRLMEVTGTQELLELGP